MTPNNPLKNFFRQPAIYLKLPSDGKFYPPNALDITANRELPVFPMTARDEITYRTPDALFNGSALVSVIQSCVPNIKNAWEMPTCDIDTILIAIRIASYGHSLELESKCPSCENEAAYMLDLRGMLEQIQIPDFSQPLMLGDLTVNFKPMNYKTMNDASLENFENQKRYAVVKNVENEEEKNKVISELMERITDSTFKSFANSIQSIKTLDVTVTQPELIVDFLNNCDRRIYSKIKEVITQHRSQSSTKPIKIKCEKCSHEYEQQLTLDMTSFFEIAS